MHLLATAASGLGVWIMWLYLCDYGAKIFHPKGIPQVVRKEPR